MYVCVCLYVHVHVGLTLHGSPGVLPGPNFVSIDDQFFSAADNSEGDLVIHLSIEIGYGLIVARKLVDVDTIVLKLLHNLLVRRGRGEGRREERERGIEGGREGGREWRRRTGEGRERGRERDVIVTGRECSQHGVHGQWANLISHTSSGAN